MVGQGGLYAEGGIQASMKPWWLMHEERIAYHLNGRRVPGSGSGKRKGDVWVGKDWMIEAKTTTRCSYILNIKTLDKIAQQSMMMGLCGALLIVFHRSYTDFVRFALVLERRCENLSPDWRSISLTPEKLEVGIELSSRYGIWKSMTFSEFQELVLDHGGGL